MVSSFTVDVKTEVGHEVEPSKTVESMNVDQNATSSENALEKTNNLPVAGPPCEKCHKAFSTVQ